MAVRVNVTNLAKVLDQIDAKEEQVGDAVSYAIEQVAIEIQGKAQENASGRPGPNVRTGNLRRSIRTSTPVKGFGGSYSVDVSATMVYARAVEFGHPRWKPGTKYPYLGPAALSLSKSGEANRIFTRALADRLRGA